MRKGKNKAIAMVLTLGVTASMLFTSVPGMIGALTGTGNSITKAEAAVEFYTKLEAEDATMTGDVKAATTRAGYSGTGYATGFTQASNNSWSIPVTIPAEGFYTFTIRSAADSYKENYLYIDGAQAGTIYSTADSEWGNTVIESVYLNAGTITLSVKEFWGWFDLDYIEIKNGVGVEDSYYEGATAIPVNPNATQKTKDIMTYLKSIYGKKTLSGQTCTLNKNTEIETIHRETGKYPALRTFDFIFCSPASDWHNTTEVDLAQDWNERGGLTSFAWHWHAPKGGASFYTKNTTFDLSKAVTTQNISRLPLSEIKAMYEAGTITEETYLMVRDVDVISGYLAQLQDAGVTVLWRPLHEASGGWFWWGAAGSEPYLWLWNLMFDRQTYYHELNNLIWVWNGQDAAWYPGDESCDIVGTDIYADKHNYIAQTAAFKKTANYSNRNKMAALSENGVMLDPDLMIRDNTYWLWFAVWYGDFIIDTSGNFNNLYTESFMIKKVYSSDKIITLEQLPNFNGTNPTTAPTVTPTATPTVAPTSTPTITPSITPTATPTVAPTATPTTVPTTTPVPVKDFKLSLTNTGNTDISTNTIKNNIRLKHESGSDIDLSKLVIRYYYTKDSRVSENFYCDTAAIQFNKAPWYKAYTSELSGTLNPLATPKTTADTYLELKLASTDKLTAGATLILDSRIAKSDWSLYNQDNDYSYGDNTKIVVYYDDKLVLGVEP